jgi:hypothetical protein
MSDNCLTTTWQLSDMHDKSLTFPWQLSDSCQEATNKTNATQFQLADDYLKMATGWSLSYTCLTTAWKLPNDYLMTARDCLMTAWWLPDDCKTTAWQMPDKCLINAKLPVIPHWRPKIQITKWNLPNQLKALNAQAFVEVFLLHQIFPTLISILKGFELNFPCLSECMYNLILDCFNAQIYYAASFVFIIEGFYFRIC